MQTLVLHGYGISIRVRKGKLVITNGVSGINEQAKVIEVVDNPNFDKIIITGNSGYVSFKALEWLAYLGVNVVMLDKKGELYANLSQVKGDIEPLIRMKQYQCFTDLPRVEYLRNWIVTERISSQIQLLRERIMYDKYAKLNAELIGSAIEVIEKNLELIQEPNSV